MNQRKDRALYTINFILDVLNAAEDLVVTTVKEDEKDSREQLFECIDDDGVAVGKKVRITSDLPMIPISIESYWLILSADLKNSKKSKGHQKLQKCYDRLQWDFI